MRTPIPKLGIALVAVSLLSTASPSVAGPWIETARLLRAPGAAGDSFGAGVAIDGDVAVIGLPGAAGGTGAAAVFLRTVGGWAEAAELAASEGATADAFGSSVAISGDTIVVGAPGALVADAPGEGKAYVFVRPAAGWSGALTENARLENSRLAVNVGAVGSSVAISGDFVAVGAPSPAPGAETGSPGAVLVWARPVSGWSGTPGISALLEPSDGADGDLFGWSVGASGDTVVAGAPGPPSIATPPGKSYVFVRPAAGWSGTLAESARLVASDGFLADRFGFACAIDGDTVAVTNQWYGPGNKGYVFVRPSTGWTGVRNEDAGIVADPLRINPNAQFGASVSVSGEWIVVGTRGLIVIPFSSFDGGAFLYRKPSSGWSGGLYENAKIYRVSADTAHSLLGSSVSISGNTILLGAPNETIDVDAQRGAAHVFEVGLNPAITASFSPGNVLTFQPSTLSLVVANPNATGFLSNMALGTNASVPPGLVLDSVPNLATTCGGTIVLNSTAFILSSFGGDPLPAGASCTLSGDVSTGIPATYTTLPAPVQCDQGCDGGTGTAATLVVRLRATQTRVLVNGPVRVAPGVPVEFTYGVDTVGKNPGPGGITGEVVVSDGAGHACRSDLSGGGVGSCSITFESSGTFQVRASYLGDISFGGSTSPPATVFVR
jgi:hypothetical protein